MAEVHMMTAFIAVRAALFAAAFLWAWFWVVRQVQPWSREWDSVLPMWLGSLGPLLLLVGAAGVLICIAVFVVRGRGTPAIFDAPREFVAVGPYRRVRNPMYLSAAAVFAGYGLLARSLAVLAFVVSWWLLMHAIVMLVEEPGLRRRFGNRYAEYCRRVPRWIPRLVVFIVLTVGAAGAAQGRVQAGPADFSGTWVLDRDRSDYGPFPLPERRIDMVEQTASGLKVSRREVVEGAERAGEWTCRTDAVECINTIRGTVLKSTARWEQATLFVETRTTYEGQDAFIEDRWVLSPDRRTLTISRHAVSPMGTADQVFVFVRQSDRGPRQAGRPRPPA
jgi:protein-S-isoprenylcysteine O-methyltransferase Ste14